ncbi:hypothetical protein X975_25572, partial [Stegodyphus mimosarum]
MFPKFVILQTLQTLIPLIQINFAAVIQNLAMKAIWMMLVIVISILNMHFWNSLFGDFLMMVVKFTHQEHLLKKQQKNKVLQSMFED